MSYIRTLIWGVLPLCREAVGVFCSLNIIMEWYLDIWNLSWQTNAKMEKNYASSFNTFLIKFLWKTLDCTCAALFILPFSCFGNRKFYSVVRFENMQNIKRNKTAKLHFMPKKRSFRGTLTNGKLSGMPL